MKNKLFFIFIFMLKLSVFAQNLSPEIINIGPYPSKISGYKFTGRTTDIVTFKSSRIILLGTSSAGVWKSVDSGQTWTCTSENLPGGVNSFAVNSDSSLIFADFSIYINGIFRTKHYSYGVFYSDNLGETWKPTSLTFKPEEFIYIHKIAIHKNHVYVLTSHKLTVLIDNDNRWKELTVVQDSSNEFLDFTILDNGSIVISGVNYLRISNKKQKKWTNILPEYLQQNSNIKVTSYKNIFWASIFNSKMNKNTIIKSSNFGKSYNIYKHNLSLKTYANGIWAFNDSIIFTGGIKLYYSINGGFSFKNISGSFHADIRNIEFIDKNNFKNYLLSTDGGVFHTVNNKKFTLFSDISLLQLYSVSVSQLDTFELLTGAHDNGTFLMNKSGVWTHVLGGDGGGALVSASTSHKFAVIGKSLLYFTKYHNHWNYSNKKTSSLGVNPAQNPIYNKIIYAGSYSAKNKGDILRSIDYGKTFVENNLTSYAAGIISCIEPCYDSSETIYYSSCEIWGNNSYAFYKTQYFQDTIIRKRLLFERKDLKITGITADEKNSARVWICFTGFEKDYKVKFSNDNGETWANLSYNLPNIPIYSIIYISSANKLLVGTDWGIYYLDKEVWLRFDDKFPYVPVTDFDYNRKTNELFISTYGRGLWKVKI